MNLTEYLHGDRILYLDGGMGTLLQTQGLTPGELPERWNLTHPEIITAIHQAYFDAGAHIKEHRFFCFDNDRIDQ